MIELVFATNNLNKLKEVQQMISHEFKVISLSDINCFEEIPETGTTLQANALQKARFIHQKYQCNVFADDTGLEVDSLNGEPGVYSARYAGLERDSNKNMEKLLSSLEHKPNRDAQFRTAIALILDDKEIVFEGIVKGSIAKSKTGIEGFGYDPIFVPKGYSLSFSEMSASDKNKISHRGRAIQLLADFLSGK